MSVIKCPNCKKRYETETDIDDIPKGASAKVVCPACDQWLRIPEKEMIDTPKIPKELAKKIKAQSRLVDDERIQVKKSSTAVSASSSVVVTCPECEKKFKPKSDVRGKKIKCPFCTNPFVVPTGKDGNARSEAIKSGNPKEAASQVAVGPAPAQTDIPLGEYDADPNPYGVTNVDLVPRCPNCTEEMGEHDIICLACGYNTMTRQWGKTKKVVGITVGRHFLYLLPALGSAAFVFFSIIFLIYYCVMSPYHVYDVPILWLTDHESVRMWTTLIFLAWLWGAGLFCFKKFVEKPKPDEVQLD
jgi:hypothetical protein